MNFRELFRSAMAFERIDELPHMEFGFWDETYRRWHKEGLPEHITSIPNNEFFSGKQDLFGYLQIARALESSFNQYYYPVFPKEVLEETDDYAIEKDERGVTLKRNKCNCTIPQFLEYPIKCRKDYEEYRGRLTGHIAQRFQECWERNISYIKEQQKNVVRIRIDGFFAYPRELMGLENFLMMLYDEPKLIKEMLSDRVAFVKELLQKAIIDIRPDFVFIWEDMCYKNGPLLSPEMFNEFLMPVYQELTSFLKNMGIKTIIVDSDGDISKLIPLWIESGVTGLLPFEVNAGMDVTKIAEAYPRLQILGGIDKTEIARGRQHIDAELKRVLPYMIKRGGYVAALDHHAHPEISFDDFKYYNEQIQKYSRLKCASIREV